MSLEEIHSREIKESQLCCFATSAPYRCSGEVVALSPPELVAFYCRLSDQDGKMRIFYSRWGEMQEVPPGTSLGYLPKTSLQTSFPLQESFHN